MQILLISQIIKRDSILLGFIQVQRGSSARLSREEYIKYKTAEDGNAVAINMHTSVYLSKEYPKKEINENRIERYQIINPVHNSG